MNTADAAIDLDAGGTEPQYRTGFEIFAADTPADVIDQLLVATSGELAENGGVWKIRLGGPGLPVYFFTDDDVILDQPEEFTPFRAEQEPFNAVQATHPDPATLWQPRDAPARFTAEFALADPAQRRVASLDLGACPFPNQVQRVMRAYVEEEQRLVRHVLSLPQDALLLEQLDVVSWTSARRQYSAKAFEIARAVDPLVMGKPRFTLKERDPADSAWITDYELPVGIPDSGPVSVPVQFVEGFAVSAIAIEDAAGNDARPGLEMTWTGMAGDLTGIQFEIEAADGSTILTVSSIDTESGVYRQAEAILPNKDYQVRAKFLASRPTAFSAWMPVTSLDLKIQPGDLDEPSFEVAGLSVFGGALQSDNFVTGQSGWRIGQDGSMEVQSLVTRDWIVEGALSDGADIEGAGGTHAPTGTVVLAAPIGEMRPSQLWHFTFSGSIRSGGVRWENGGTNSQGDPIFYRYTYGITLLLQYRGMVGGVWEDWITAYSSGFYTGGWTEVSVVQHLLGDYENAEIRALIYESDTLTANSNSAGATTYPQANWSDFALSARAALS